MQLQDTFRKKLLFFMTILCFVYISPTVNNYFNSIGDCCPTKKPKKWKVAFAAAIEAHRGGFSEKAAIFQLEAAFSASIRGCPRAASASFWELFAAVKHLKAAFSQKKYLSRLKLTRDGGRWVAFSPCFLSPPCTLGGNGAKFAFMSYQ